MPRVHAILQNLAAVVGQEKPVGRERKIDLAFFPKRLILIEMNEAWVRVDIRGEPASGDLTRKHEMNIDINIAAFRSRLECGIGSAPPCRWFTEPGTR